jgi:phosphatidylglycerol:prolipoprotein diacylglycerol transferase
LFPTLFRIGEFELSTFGLMMVAGFLAAGAMNARSYPQAGIPRDLAWDLLVWAMVGGVLGAKLWYVGEQVARDPGLASSLFEWGGPLFSRGGLTWYGGLLGGAAAAIAGGVRRGVRPLALASASAASLAVGQGLGRIGCFLVGDDYGAVSDVPWAIAFPQGLPPTEAPVHPTQLYEAAWLFAAGWILWRRRASSPLAIAEYLVLAGLGRFWIELLRTNPPALGPLTNAQLVALACMALGALAWLRARARMPDRSGATA